MAQKGFVYKQGSSWFLKYRQDRKQKCVKLADYSNRYRRKRDLDDLVTQKMAAVHQAAKCSQPGRMFTDYIEKTYLPRVKEEKKASTYAGRKAYYERSLLSKLAENPSRTYPE